MSPVAEVIKQFYDLKCSASYVGR